MRLRQMTALAGWRNSAGDQTRALPARFAGAPFILAAATPCLAFQPATVIAAFVLTVLAAFTVHLPVTAAVLAATAPDTTAPNTTEPALSRRIYLLLLTIWTLTAWVMAAISA